MKKKKLAVFDVDGTIFRSSLLIELVDILIAGGVFDKAVASEFEREKKAWLDRRGDYDSYINAVVATFMSHIKGVRLDDFTNAAAAVVKTHKDRVYRYTRDLAKKLKRRGYFLLAISQSPKGVLDEFCKRLGFDKVYGRFYEVGASERFTGVVEDLHLIVNKANIVKRAVEKHKLSLKGSYGVGDTEGDISFLELVDKPICFNPNMKLFKHAERSGWKVVVERKDVIYEIG